MKTKIIIDIDTKFRKQLSLDKDEDITKDVEKEFHSSIMGIVEDLLQRDDFEQEWVEYLDRSKDEYEYIPQDDDADFSNFGEISIKISHLKDINGND